MSLKQRPQQRQPITWNLQKKKTDVIFTDFFFTFIFCEILVSDSCLETGVVSQWVYAQLRGVNQVLAERRLARINPELWVVTERMRSQTQAAQMSFQVLLN